MVKVCCNNKRCGNNKNYVCQADKIKLRDVDSKKFDDDIEDIEVSPLASTQVIYGMLVCMSFKEKEYKAAIIGKIEKVTEAGVKTWA